MSFVSTVTHKLESEATDSRGRSRDWSLSGIFKANDVLRRWEKRQLEQDRTRDYKTLYVGYQKIKRLNRSFEFSDDSPHLPTP